MTGAGVIEALCVRVEHHRRLIAWVLVGIVLASAAALQCAWPASHPMTELVEELGVLLIAASISGRIFCMMYIGGRKNRSLLREGPYAVSRNPLYVCSVLGVTGAGLSSGTVTLGALSGGLFALLFACIIRSEDRRLAAMFGAPYLDYLAKVPRWLPAFRLWRDPPWLSPRAGLIVRTLRDTAALFLAIPVMEALEYAHAAGVLPALLTVP